MGQLPGHITPPNEAARSGARTVTLDRKESDFSIDMKRLAKHPSKYPWISHFGVIRPLSPSEVNVPDPPADRVEITLRRHEMARESRARNDSAKTGKVSILNHQNSDLLLMSICVLIARRNADFQFGNLRAKVFSNLLQFNAE